jgi:hypothetical protein
MNGGMPVPRLNGAEFPSMCFEGVLRSGPVLARKSLIQELLRVFL